MLLFDVICESLPHDGRTIPKSSATAEIGSVNPTPGPFQPRFREYA